MGATHTRYRFWRHRNVFLHTLQRTPIPGNSPRLGTESLYGLLIIVATTGHQEFRLKQAGGRHNPSPWRQPWGKVIAKTKGRRPTHFQLLATIVSASGLCDRVANDLVADATS